MRGQIIYLECPHCDYVTLLSMVTSLKKWNPEQKKRCPECDTTSEISEWNWYEKHSVPFLRPMSTGEAVALIRNSGETADKVKK